MSIARRINTMQGRVEPRGKLARSVQRSTRGGYLLLEVAAATLLLTAVMIMVAGAVRVRLATHRHSQQRQMALEEANNLLERLTAGTQQVTSTGDAQPAGEAPVASEVTQLSAAARAALPEARLHIRRDDDQLGLQRIAVEIDWQLRSGQRSRAVRLVGWAPASRSSSARSAP
jgi:hypothetical protein